MKACISGIGLLCLVGAGVCGNGGESARLPEKAMVELVRAGKTPSGVATGFVEAVRRVEALGGQFDFDRAGRLVGVDLAGDRVSATDADIPFLLALPSLRRLKLSGGGITGLGARQIAQITGLVELALIDAQIDNAALGQLARLANLDSLMIRRSPLLSDEGLKALARLSKLTSLGLLDVGITDRGVALLAELPRISVLDLRGCSQLSDAGLRHLRAMRRLRVLRLGGYQIADTSLEIVKDLKWLQGLTIDEASITDAGLARLAGLPLEEITLSRCYGLTDAGLLHLQGFANLAQLGIRDIPLAGDGLKCLAGKDKLTRLRLNGTGIGDAALQHIRGLRNLSRLELRQTQITDAGLEILGGLKSLQSLDLQQTGVSDAGVKRLAERLPHCKILH
jgi:internalin A